MLILRIKLVVIFVLVLLGLPSKTVAQQVFPVQANSQLLFPNSLYVEDYFAPGGNQWQINLNFLDFAEPYREVKLHLKIEGNSVLMETKPEVTDPSLIFTLLPGQSQVISGVLLEPYFNAQNMNLQGITWSQLSQNGRLPEGFYTFCVEVIDVYSGEVLSTNSCSSAWLRLNDQPIINTPFCGQVIPTNVPLNVMFQWQANNTLSVNPQISTEYQLTLFEVTNTTISPFNAVGNGDVIQVFQSVWSNQPTFLYDMSAPSLDVGKCYAYSVQARDVGGRDLFKNNGFSEVCWLYYGYPEGGNIPLLEPADSSGFAKYDRQYFRWDNASLLVPNQPVNYEIQIVEVDSGSTSINAMANAITLFHQEVFPVYYGGTGYDFELDKSQKTFEKGKRYAWKIIANSGTQIVAESRVNTFLGPPIVDEFFVNNHKVEVVSLSTSDLQDLSGLGRVQLDDLGEDFALMEFGHISLTDYGGVYFLSNGSLSGEVETKDSIVVAIQPDLAINGGANAYFSKVRLSNATDLDVKSRVFYQFPLITNEADIPELITGQSWMDYTGYVLTGNCILEEDVTYELLDPVGFDFTVFQGSEVAISSNEFQWLYKGQVEVPDNVAGYDPGQRVAYRFHDQNQFFYLTGTDDHYRTKLIPVGEMNIRIEPQSYVVDLSSSQSPGKFTTDPNWKGVYLNNFDVKFNPTSYSYSSLQFGAVISKNINLVDSDSTKAWITSSGLNLMFNETFESNKALTYNTFPGEMNNVRIEVYNSSVTNSYLKGDIQVPFLSPTAKFNFVVPMTYYGYNQGYLTDNIDSTTYVFNQGAGDNEVFITVNRAVFADKQKLILNIGLDWPGLQINVEDVDGFMIWGNHNVGFGKSGGVLSLQEELEGVANGNEIIANNIGAGRDANLYSIGLNGEMLMGEDVSGDDGAPQFNAYSIYESPLIAENYTPGSLYNFGEDNLGTFSEGGTGGSSGFSFGDSTNSDLSFAMNALGNGLSNNGSGEDYETGAGNDTIPLPGGQGETWEPQTAGEILEKIVYFIDLFAPFMPEEKQAKALELKEKIESLEESELFEIYEELEANGFNLQAILKGQVDKLVAKMTGAITEKMDSLNLRIENAILNPVDTLVGKANVLIEDIIDGVADEIIQMVGDMDGVANVLQDAADATKMEITTAISTSIHNSVKANVTDKITVFIDTVFTLRINQFLAEEITKLGYSIIEGDMEDIAMDDIANNAGQVLENIANDIVGQFKSISMEGVKNTCKDIVDDAVDGIDWPQIGENIKNKVIESATDEVIDVVVDAIVGQFGDSLLTNSLAENLTENFEFDFSNLGEKIQNGDIGSIVKFDPTKIKIQSKVVDLEGMIIHLEDDPIYGDCWQAYLGVNVKKPKEISAYARYINGKVDGYNYWFVEMAIDKGLNIPFVGGLALDGIGGKVFKHMKYVRDENNPLESTYFPNDSVNFGVGVTLWMIDAATGGETVKLKVGAEVVIYDEGFSMEIRGNVAVKSKDNSKDASFDNALVSGEGFVGYSTIDNHFIGQFNVNANVSPLICGGGELGINIQPGFWNVYIGKKVTPIQIKLLCKDALLVKSWFEITNTTLQFGVQSEFDFYAQSPWFKVGRYWRPYAGFGWEFLAELDMSYKPNVVIHNAQVYMAVWADLGVDWERRNSDGDVWDSGNKVLFSVGMAGNLQYSQNTTQSKFLGSLEGHVTIFTIGVDFDVNVNKTM